MAIAVEESRAYWPTLCGVSNGEGEGILPVMVMMHFKWIVPIIYQREMMALTVHPPACCQGDGENIHTEYTASAIVVLW